MVDYFAKNSCKRNIYFILLYKFLCLSEKEYRIFICVLKLYCSFVLLSPNFDQTNRWPTLNRSYITNESGYFIDRWSIRTTFIHTHNIDIIRISTGCYK